MTDIRVVNYYTTTLEQHEDGHMIVRKDVVSHEIQTYIKGRGWSAVPVIELPIEDKE